MQHTLTLYSPSGKEFKKSAPAATDLYLVHKDPGDPCDGIVNIQARFDLTPLTEHYENIFGKKDPIRLIIINPNQEEDPFELLYIP